MNCKVWGVPLYSSIELLEKFKGSTLFPDVSGKVVIVPGADTLMWLHSKKLLTDKLYLCIDSPILLRGAGLPLNGAQYQSLGLYFRAPLKKSDPEPWSPSKVFNAVQVLSRNAKRVENLVEIHKKTSGKGIKSMTPWHKALNKVKDAEFQKRKDKGAGVKEEQDEAVTVAKERDE